MTENASDSPSPYDHVRAEDGSLPDGIYRVVGVGADDVTLLFVADATGSRVHDGRVFTVSHEQYADLPAAPNPDDDGLFRRWGLVALAGVLFAVSLSSTATETLGVSQSFIRTVVILLIALDVVDKLR
ncbi:hypothetical protein [Halostella pelagica]|uniref:hypothetical protein n=1 Tax=Halostella pelagica TaxID=2583824 RepID=UPI0010802B48|nr:hypothetical protein [Halostella pelagica]